MNNFYTSIDKAFRIACETNAVVTFGIKPHEFNSEYGYINSLYDHHKKHHVVRSFLEKPKYEVSNDHYWNSGIFVFKVKRYINEIKKLAPNLYMSCCASVKHSTSKRNFLYLEQQDLEGIENISIDHLVMEKIKNIAMIEANFDWMDIGTWNAVLELSKREDIKPVQHKVTRHFSGNTSRIIDSLTVLNSSLISFINKVKNMKVVKREIRPWGFFSVILTSDNFLIKRLVINPLNPSYGLKI